MKLKYFSIFIFLILLIGCVNSVSAADDNILELDQSQDIVSSSIDEKLALGIGNPLSGSEDGGSSDNDTDISPNDGTGNDGTDPNGTDVGESGVVNGTDPNGTDVGESGVVNGTDPNGTDVGESGVVNGTDANQPSNGTAGTTTPTTPSTTASVSSVQSFLDALKNGKKTIYLTNNINITKQFDISYNVVIDGKGHTIDAQKNSCIFRISGANVTIRNIILKNGKSNKGGAIFCYNGNLNLQKCSFINNIATDVGGAIYKYSGKLSVDGSTFKNNLVYSNGGAIYISTGNLVIKNSKFLSNKVNNSKKAGHGGAIATYKKSSSISNTSFQTNYCLSKTLKSHSKATKYQFTGGAIYYNFGSCHNLTGCTFTSNKASNHGGALYCYRADALNVIKCSFKTNKACFEDGGVMAFSGKKLVMKNSNFTKNHAYEDGGVMDACSFNKKKIYITISGCNFKQNTAYKGGGTFWMGIYTVFNIKNSKFISNKAGGGGALKCESTIAKITNCLFQGNQAKKLTSWVMKTKGGKILKFCGGAINIENKNIQLIKCTIKKNHASVGGAIFQSGGKLKLTSTKFSGNTAKNGPKIKKI